MLSDYSERTFVKKTDFCYSRNFKSEKKLVLSNLNKFLSDSQERPVGCYVQMDFQKSVQTTQLNRIFTETGSNRMLEILDYDAENMELPFMSEIGDECCNFLITASYTKAIAEYAVIISLIIKGIKILDGLRRKYVYLR